MQSADIDKSASAPGAGQGQSAIKRQPGAFSTSVRSWLSAMEKAKRIKPGGRLVFVNKRTGSAVALPTADPTQVSGVE